MAKRLKTPSTGVLRMTNYGKTKRTTIQRGWDCSVSDMEEFLVLSNTANPPSPGRVVNQDPAINWSRQKKENQIYPRALATFPVWVVRGRGGPGGSGHSEADGSLEPRQGLLARRREVRLRGVGPRAL